MKLKGYFMTSINYDKVKSKVEELGDRYYSFRKYKPVYEITFKDDYDEYSKNEKGIFCSCDRDIQLITLLGYGFEGLYEDEEKIREIEDFGKYKCYVKYFDNIEISEDIMEINILFN